MRKTIALVLIPVMAVTPALAVPGVTTTDVNFRSGPGTNYASIEVLAAGTAVDIGDCGASGSWCAVTVGDQSGFVSGKYLQESDDPQGWPRVYEVGAGRRMVLYQPQFTDWTEFKTIQALVAAEYVKTDDANPAFGVIGLAGTSTRDEIAGEIVITDIRVTKFDFSGLDRDDLTTLAVETGKLLPTGPITVSEARVAASLAEQARMTDIEDLKADPPPIFASTTPAILVQTDGEAAYAPVKGAPGLSFVVNTNWDLLRVDDGGAFYLRDDSHWLTASALTGPWTPVTELPALLKGLPDDENWSDARTAMPPEPFPEGIVPKVIVTDRPSELLLFDGEPTLEDVPGTRLRWVSNTESDVFLDTAGDQWYTLLSGRWFRASSLEGLWTFATPDLPADFLNIPEDAPYYAVRASIPGTSESAEARLKASIPTTARVEVGSVTPEIAYAGEPVFAPIETTDLAYAANTNDTVIQVGSQYFLLQDGVWFVSNSPNGPWELARDIPDAIYDIPPSAPVYNVTYVRVYDAEPDAVWYGYTMGYLSGFLAWGTYVFGTGWHYGPYWYNLPSYSYPIYFPRPVTWGIGAYYNPLRGAYGRYGYAYGPYRGIAGARVWNPRTGAYARGVAWGPRGSAGFVAAYRPRRDAGSLVTGRNVYGSWRSAGVTRGSDWARISARETTAGRSALRWNSSAAGAGFIREGRRGDIYAGRDGNIYRSTGDGWQTFDGGWRDVARPEAGELLQRGEGLGDLSPEARGRLEERGAGRALEGLAAGTAGAAIGQRLGGGATQSVRERTDGRPRQGQATDQRGRGAATPGAAARQRPQAQQQRTTQQRAAARQRPAVQQQRTTSRRPPVNVQRDARARQVGNQRHIAQRSASRSPPRQVSRRSSGRSGGGRGGGGRGGGRR